VRPGDRRDRVRSQYEYVVYEPVIQERLRQLQCRMSSRYGLRPFEPLACTGEVLRVSCGLLDPDQYPAAVTRRARALSQCINLMDALRRSVEAERGAGSAAKASGLLQRIIGRRRRPVGHLDRKSRLITRAFVVNPR
jgi:hypothetical protein